MPNDTRTMLRSQNEARGFLGRIRGHAEPNEAWVLAVERIAEATGCPADAIRGFLDSRYGRHFAEDVANALVRESDLTSALERTIEHWMDRRIGDCLEEELGIPSGLPCLTGLVRMHEALAGPEQARPNLPH